VVLVGGFGTRLQPLTLSTPKQMLPIIDRPMIERVLGSLNAHGVTDAVLALGYRPDAFLDAYPDGHCAGVELHYAVESEPLDTAGAVRFAARSAGIDDTFIVVNGDVLTDLDLTELWNFHKSHDAEGSIALTPVDDPSRYGVVPIDDDGRVLEFVEKPAPGTAPTNWINAGTYILEASVLDRIPDGRRVSIERETFPSMVADRSLYALRSDAYWIDAGTPVTYLDSQLDLIDGVRGTAERAIHETATIQSGAVIDHSVVMAGVVVESGAIVRNSVLLPGSRIGAEAHVVHSVIGSGAEVGAGSEVLDYTVVGNARDVPAGVRLEGARIPEGS
jgi:mannose-1-phosphate guanylyltransferase